MIIRIPFESVVGKDKAANLVTPCRDNSKRKDVRISNIEAAKALADKIRTSLGPRGMDKMVRGVKYAQLLQAQKS